DGGMRCPCLSCALPRAREKSNSITLTIGFVSPSTPLAHDFSDPYLVETEGGCSRVPICKACGTRQDDAYAHVAKCKPRDWRRSHEGHIAERMHDCDDRAARYLRDACDRVAKADAAARPV